MISKTLFASLIAVLMTSFAPPSNEKPIVVVIPSYKNQQWCRRNLDSVFSQNYHNYRVIYIDDASPDGTADLVQAYTEEKEQQHRLTLIRNPERVGALANLYKGIWLCASDEIIANLDGDDWYSHENVLSKLNETYADPGVWVTYGQFMYYPDQIVGFAQEISPEVIANNAFREQSRGTTALRSFYAGLFHKINREDLFYNGTFFPSAWDLALMWPILEMAGPHSRFIPDVCYVYNIDNPINDFKTNLPLQENLDVVTRHMPRYSPIEKPYD